MFWNNDNWEGLVAAILKKEELCQPVHGQPTKPPSISSVSSGNFSFRFNLASPQDDVPFSFSSPERPAAYNQKKDDLKVTHSRRNRADDDTEKENHPLPLPPEAISNSSCVSRRNSAAKSSLVLLRNLERFVSPTFWKKGKFLGRGAFGDVYIGFNSEKGEMCAIKEVASSFYDAKSKKSVKMFGKEIALLLSLKHPHIIQSYGSETVGDNFFIFFEYASGGPIYDILQEHGQLGESAIRNYTKQILIALTYLHSKNIAHGDIKSDNILIAPNGRVKLFKFGIENHIAGKSHQSLLVDSSPYWMAPEVIMNSNAGNVAVDIWSLGCTVLEMATAKPPNSQYNGAIAMSKVAHHREIPTIPNHLSDECKDFLRHCLQWNPHHRATAAQLLEHPFVKSPSPFATPPHSRQRIISAPVSLVGSPRLHPRSSSGISAIPYSNLPTHSPTINSPSYWDPRILEGAYLGFHEPASSNNDVLRKKSGSPSNGQVHQQYLKLAS